MNQILVKDINIRFNFDLKRGLKLLTKSNKINSSLLGSQRLRVKQREFTAKRQ